MSKLALRSFFFASLLTFSGFALGYPALSQVMPEKPDGYFVYKGTLYAKAGGTICGFTSQVRADIYRRVKGGPDLPITAISTYKNSGECPLPRAFFNYKGTGMYTYDNGKFCKFGNASRWEAYKQRNDVKDVGTLPSDPRNSLSDQGFCKPL